MSSAAPLGSHFPLPSVFRQVLKRGCATAALGMGSEPPRGAAPTTPPWGSWGPPPSAALRGSRGEGTGMELGQGWGPGARSLDQEGGTRGCQTHPPGWAPAWLGTPASSCPSRQSFGGGSAPRTRRAQSWEQCRGTGAAGGCRGCPAGEVQVPAAPRSTAPDGAGAGRAARHVSISHDRVNWSLHTSQHRAVPIKGQRSQN